MKLLEVMYPKCKKCGYDFSKGGRDHRVGLCDVCAFPGKKKKVKEGLQADAFTAQVKELLWQDYQQDPMSGATEEDPMELDDEDFLEFEEHIEDIVKFARQHRIRNPQQAIAKYTDSIRNDPRWHPTVH